MPKSLVDPRELRIELSSLSDLNFVVGFCFQGVLNRPKWWEAFKFRYFIDVEINRVSLLEGDT